MNNEIEILFNRWLFVHNKKNEKVLKNFIFIFSNNLIKLTRIQRNQNLNLYAFDEFYSSEYKKIIDLVIKFKAFFEIISLNKSEILIFFDDRLIKIYFKKSIPRNVRSIKKFFIFFYKIKFIYHENSFLNYFKNNFHKLFFKNFSYRLDYNKFLNINLKQNKLDLFVRNQNIKIVTDNNKNIYIKDILSFFKISNNKKKILSKIYFNKKLFLSSFESLIPISFNKKYWESSNYFLLKNIIHGFFHNNIPYQDQNKKFNISQILNVKKQKTIKDEKKIQDIILSDDIIIINNRVYAGRNRILSMVGHIINGGKFLEINYKKYFDSDEKKQRIIRVLAEIVFVYKYDRIVFYNLDSNYKKILSKINLNTKQKFTNNINLKNKLILFSQTKSKKIINFYEVNNIVDFFYVPLILLFKNNKRLKCVYIDKNNNVKIYNPSKKFFHVFNIILTSFRPKLIYITEK